MSVKITSEVAPLKKVMLHRPGAELEHLAPGELERLLFDDIPYLRAAQMEHDRFADVLRENGAEVVYLEDLAAESLRAGHGIKEAFIAQFIEEGGPLAKSNREALTDYLLGLEDEKALILKTMSGVTLRELEEKIESPLAELIHPENRFILDPIPNLYFTRDPMAVTGRGICVNRMYSATRRRETIYGEYILKYHPDMKDCRKYYYRRTDPFSIEGGDILDLSSKVLAVGISQRTSPEAVELLARNLFSDETSEIRTILAFYIPRMRAYMHLDTVFTQVDHGKFVVHPGVLESLRLFKLTPAEGGKSIRVEERFGELSGVLSETLETDDITLIRCGGNDSIASDREQWNDGSNTLCISPGRVIAYDRNHVTNRILEDNGIEVLEIPSSELSRGRGGPRCMSMPLLRSE